jgi:hypothetical protein
MRKEVEPEEEKAAVASDEAAPVAVHAKMEQETELEDKDLLGESTLAKLSPAPKHVEPEAEIDETDVPLA